MKRLALITVFAGIIALSLSGCATTGTGDAAKKTDAGKTTKTTLGPSKLYEHCMDLSQKHNMVYSFESEEPVNFYIHYHHEGSRYELDRRDEVTALEGTFSADMKQVHCLTWTNPQSKPVEIKYSFVIQEK